MVKIQGFSEIGGRWVDTAHNTMPFQNALALARGFKAMSWQIVNGAGKVLKAGKPE